MIGRQSGLGRGLGALIPQRPVVAPIYQPGAVPEDAIKHDLVSSTMVKDVPVDLIDPNPHQPRQYFDHTELDELAGSIKQYGILQPLVVTSLTSGRYELVVGERRWRAAKIAGLPTVPAIVRSATEQEKAEMALIENVQRSDLNPVEEAYGYLRLLEEFGIRLEEIAQRVGVSRSQISNTIRLLQLPQEIQRALIEKKISYTNARTLLSLPTDEERVQLFKALLAGNFTVRQTESRVPHRLGPRRQRDPNIAGLETRLRDALSTRVFVRRTSTGEGEIRIPFYDQEDLDGITKRLVGE